MKIERLYNDMKYLNLSNKNIKGVIDLEKLYGLEVLNCSNNDITKIINIPFTLKEFNLSNNKINSLLNLPPNIEKIIYTDNPITNLHYPINIKPIKYPLLLKKIIYDNEFNQPIDNLPNGLIKIKFTQICKFNQPIKSLPNSLNILIFGNSFNQPLNNLPLSLNYLKLGNIYNNSLDYLPNSLLYLIIGNGCSKFFFASCIFNQPLDNLPNSLIELTFSNESIFQKSLNNLPNSLKKLTLSGYYNRSINNLSDSIETIILGPTWFKYNEKTYYPLCLKNKINKLPKSLKKLYVINYFIKEEYIELNFDNLELLNKELEKSYNNPYTLENFLDFCKVDINNIL